MKNWEPAHIIHYYFDKLQKYADQIEDDYSEETIHLFRVDVKKLRAFLRMMREAAGEPDQLKFPQKFKKMYSLTGKIRDRQLYIKRIKEHNKPIGKSLRNKARYLKNEIKALSGRKDDFFTKREFEKLEENMISRLPVIFENALAEHFFQQKLHLIKEIVGKGDYKDSELHSIRKSIKDIIYIIRIFRDDIKKPLPVPIWNEADLKRAESLSHKLGLFNDACIALSFLEPAQIKKADAGDKENLQAMRREWLKEKQKLKKEILDELPAIGAYRPQPALG